MRFKEPAVQAKFRDFKRDVILSFTDLDSSYLLKIHEASVGPFTGALDKKVQVQVVMDSGTFLGILNRTVDGVSALLSGKIKVHASLSDLLKLQELLK